MNNRADLFQIHLGPWNQSRRGFQDVGEQPGGIKQPDNPDGCPSIGVFFAYLSTEDLAVANVTVLLCSQKIQKVQAEVSLRPNGTGRIGQRSLLSPPHTDESTVEYLTNGTDGVFSFHYRIEPHFAANFTHLSTDNSAAALDSFFNHVVSGLHGTSLKDMTGPDNVDRLKNAIDDLYRRYMVQVMNTPIFRKPLDRVHPADRQVFDGTANILVSRLTVDFASKMTVQLLLLTMLVLETASLSQVRLRGLLPRSPCSIASVMALLAGSNMCRGNVISEGEGGRTSREPFGESFRRHTFGMGWWDDDTESAQARNTVNGGGEEDAKSSRFGIDIGEPTRFGFRLKEEIKKKDDSRYVTGKNDAVNSSQN